MPDSPKASAPDFFPLPTAGGGGDPYWGFSRTWWLECEREKCIKLRRTKRTGHRACRVEIPYADAERMIADFQSSPMG